MNKKTVLAETNRKQKISNKIPSATNLRPKSSHAIQCAEKAIQHDSSPIKSQSKEKKLATPKTKFTARDRSAEFCSFSSSRLKSFPVEEIKRIQYSPRPEIIPPPNLQHPDHPEQHLLNHEIIHGQGDGLFNHYSPQKSPNAVHFNNQHHLSHPECRQTRPEVIIPSSYLRSSDGQAHRPFVPISRAYHFKEPEITTSLIINQGSSAAAADNFKAENKKEVPEECLQVQEKNSDEILKEIESEKQPVGGRNALLHRLKYMAQKNQTETCQKKEYFSFLQNHAPVENPEKNIPRKCTFPQPDHVREAYADYYNVQRPVDKIANEPMACPQNQMMNQGWNHGNVIDHRPENINLHNKFLNVSRHPPECFKKSQNSATYDKKIKTSQRIHQNLEKNQNDGYPPRKSTTHEKKSKEKIYRFTPAMIRDQELLVTKMRQQGVKEEIMKRQFDALLNEQKRQLMYVQQFEESEELINDDRLSVRRRIIKIEEDGKPEWMAYITPPQIPYATVEKVNQQNLKPKNNRTNKSVRFNDQEEQPKSENEDFYQLGYKNGLQNTNYTLDPSVHQPWEQKMMPRATNNGHHWIVNNQNYLIQQQQGMSDRNDGYYLMQYPVQPQQNVPMWSNNYFVNHDPRQQYVNNLNYANYFNPNDNLHQNYGEPCSQENSKIVGKSRRLNNGLQDEESIKAAMEELKNWENRKGYEYLVNLNKTDKRLILNGVQDPEDELMRNFPFRQQPMEDIEDERKEPRANGLENKRNSNNPPPPSNLHMKNFNEPFKEYPRRKNELSAKNYHYVLPENMMTNENSSSLDRVEYQQFLPALKNIPDYSRKNSLMAQVYQVQGQIAGPYDYHNGYQLVRSNSMPCDMYPHRHQLQGNVSNIQNVRTLGNNCQNDQGNFISVSNNNNENSNICNYIPRPQVDERLNSECELNNQGNPNNLQSFQEAYQLVEPRIIGGIKYFARKFNYGLNSNNCSYPMDDRILNSPVICNKKNWNE